ncbi:MAG: portal protein [Flavobacteriaceae bacterium]|nr:portal protein [Flavobacteriaceae bacterium]
MNDIDPLIVEKDLYGWVDDLTEKWRDHYSSNYEESHDEYYRLWRGIWSAKDRTRQSERSQLIAPALQQAVESNVAEIETATFSQSTLFMLEDDDEDPKDVAGLQYLLHKDIDRAAIRPAIGEVLINAAVYGTGIAELVIEESTEYRPATRQGPEMAGSGMAEYGVEEITRPIVKMKPIIPKNFLIDPSATCISSAMGVCIDEMVSKHSIELLMESGVYRDVDIDCASGDLDIAKDAELLIQPEDTVQIKRYYGHVPRDLLVEAGVDGEELPDSQYVEAIVVIASGQILKALANPYMMKDRPVMAFSWDCVPSRFWGRGVCEKGYMSQKALDAEMRARVDALALTTHPMMAVDVSKIPRGDKFEVKPGRMIPTVGNPAESLMPFNFGQLNQISFNQSAGLQMMVQQATGALDGAQMAQGPSSDTTAAGISMSMGAVMKRQRRTLVNFQESFFKPLIKKMAYRYMQYDPEVYPIKDFTFCVVSSLGVIAREYEVAQLTQILQVTPPDSPLHATLMKAVIEHLNVSSKDELLASLEQASQPNPEQQQMQQQMQQLQMGLQEAQIMAIQGQHAESMARAEKYKAEGDLYPQELLLKYGDQDKDGQIDVSIAEKLQIAASLREEENHQLAVEERKQQMGMAQEQMQMKQQEQAQLQQMMQGTALDMAGVQVSE